MAVVVILTGCPWNIFVKLNGRSGVNHSALTAIQLPVAFHFLRMKIHTLRGGHNPTDLQGSMLGLKISMSSLSAI